VPLLASWALTGSLAGVVATSDKPAWFEVPGHLTLSLRNVSAEIHGLEAPQNLWIGTEDQDGDLTVALITSVTSAEPHRLVDVVIGPGKVCILTVCDRTKSMFDVQKMLSSVHVEDSSDSDDDDDEEAGSSLREHKSGDTSSSSSDDSEQEESSGEDSDGVDESLVHDIVSAASKQGAKLTPKAVGALVTFAKQALMQQTSAAVSPEKNTSLAPATCSVHISGFFEMTQYEYDAAREIDSYPMEDDSDDDSEDDSEDDESEEEDSDDAAQHALRGGDDEDDDDEESSDEESSSEDDESARQAFVSRLHASPKVQELGDVHEPRAVPNRKRPLESPEASAAKRMTPAAAPNVFATGGEFSAGKAPGKTGFSAPPSKSPAASEKPPAAQGSAGKKNRKNKKNKKSPAPVL
jgi:hypothetical protein